MLVDGLDQFVDAARDCCGRANNDGSPLPRFSLAANGDHVVQLAHCGVRPVSVALVHDEQVGDLEESGLRRLNAVAHAGGKQHNCGVGGRCDVDLGLSDTDGFHQDDVEAGRLENANRLRRGGSHTAELPARRHRPDEDIRVGGVRLHANAVTKQRPTSEWRSRIDGKHTDSLLAFTP